MDVTRKTHSDGSTFERLASYSRAVRIGAHVAVSGTAPMGPDGVLHPGDTYAQTALVIERALAAAAALGAAREDVIRTRMLLTREAEWEGAVRTYGSRRPRARVPRAPSSVGPRHAAGEANLQAGARRARAPGKIDARSG